ncbi:MAG: ActS/PrrB/RegB family redox-sensitive histidine kinase [Paracoccus sp. (in: a-proteobacteria)]|nr:ActS/PrrB/RegB family redox-sensitive histidine kinase [Paracoccus sp. (in: a-proteobacteria)]
MPPVQPHPEPIRLRTLIALRWVAIAGQVAAIIGAWAIGVQFALLPALVIVGVGAALNLAAANWPPKRMDEPRVMLHLLFDLAQISLLVAMTGGLSNPFALLVLAPISVASTVLSGRRTVLIGAATVLLMTAAGLLAMPLEYGGRRLEMPALLAMSHWFAIIIGVVFFAAYQRRVSSEMAATSNALFATQMALSRQQKLHDLGGVVAAAAHEMGTPLATIKLIATELRHDLARALPEREDLADDLQVLGASAERCREIMRSMGTVGKDDLLLQSAPLSAVLEEAAAPHTGRGKAVDFSLRALDETPEPTLRRDPAIVHGLRNLIQNAVDFSVARVEVAAEWDARRVEIRISDDGPGLPPHLLRGNGDILPPQRSARPDPRAGYEGMGLGLFIARTLLEGEGAELRLANAPEGGAIVTITWPLSAITADNRHALGENPESFAFR